MKSAFGTIHHLTEQKTTAETSWWLTADRDRFTDRAYVELPRMRKGSGASLADQSRYWRALPWSELG